MAGQGSTISSYAEELQAEGWTVVYTCVPNTPHIGVVPIPIAGSCKQHYPDILAYKKTLTKIVEVEIQLTSDVAAKIIERFDEMVGALKGVQAWQEFRNHVEETTKHTLPAEFNPDCELVICKNSKNGIESMVEQLATARIVTTFVK